MGKPPLNDQIHFWRDPDLPGVEMRRSVYHTRAFRKHTHETWSIGLIEAGETAFSMGGSPHFAKAGQIVLIPPETVHACNPVSGSAMAYTMLYISRQAFESARSPSGPDSPQARFENQIEPQTADAASQSPVVDDPTLFRIWRRLCSAIIHGADRQTKHAVLERGVSELLGNHCCPPAPIGTSHHSAIVALVRDYLAMDLTQKISLTDLSKLTQMDRHHILRVFQGTTGLPPHTYRNQLRVNQGKILLAQGTPISQVSSEVGFADQSHFTRIFKQFTGATPAQYQTEHIRRTASPGSL
jgi:AraC-like DNA-binding protein